LIKAIKYANKAKEYNKQSEPFFARVKFKIKTKLFKLGAIEDQNKLIQLGNKVYELYKKNENYKLYGNTYYYYFGKLYEKGIGTQKNDKFALTYYQKGAKPLHNIHDSFLIVYKRYLSIKKLNSEKFKLDMNNEPKYNIFLCLSTGVNINLLIHNKMTINDIKIELYKRQELQNLTIKCFLYGGSNLKDNEIIEKYKIKENDKIIVFVEQTRNLSNY
jgi:TPR repeat protein